MTDTSKHNGPDDEAPSDSWRTRSKQALALLVSRATATDGLLSLDCWDLKDESLRRCTEFSHRGRCCHVQEHAEALDAIKSRDSSVQNDVCDVLALCLRSGHCPAFKHHMRHMLYALEDLMLDEFGTWRDRDIGEKGVLLGPAGKRRRCDMHIKAAVEASQGSTQEVAMTKEHRLALPVWKSTVLRHQLAANWLEMARHRCLSSTFDAGRVGRPSKDYLLHLVWCPRGRCSVPLPPRAPFGKCTAGVLR